MELGSLISQLYNVEISLDYPDGSSIMRRALDREEEGTTVGIRVMQCEKRLTQATVGSEDGREPRAKKYRPPLEARTGRKPDFPLEPSKRNADISTVAH